MVDTNATQKTFEILGFTENDFLVYTAFLKHGEMSAAALARKISMDKSSTYRACENLETSGLLVKHLNKKESVYEAVNPDIIKELYTSKQSQIDILVDELKKESQSNERSTYITVEKGLPALQFRMTESLESKDKLIREKFNDKFRHFDNDEHARFVVNYAQTRAQKEIRIIQLEESSWKSNDKLKDVMKNTVKYLKEIRRLPKDASMLSSNSLRIWDNTVNIVSEDENGEFIVVTIKDKFLVKLMKDMYDFMWNRSKPV